MYAFTPRTLLYPAFALLIAVGAASQPALAQPPATPQSLQQEARKISMQLGQIERKAVAGDAKLQAEGKHFSEHMIKAMQMIGYTPKADGKKMAAIQKALSGGNLSKQERAAKIKEFQSLRARMMEAQRGVMQDKSLQKERRKLSQDTMLAMKKQDPRTDKLLKRLNEIGRKLSRMAQAARASHK